MYQKFEVKVKYSKICPDGKDRVVSENYLVEGATFGDIEETIHKELEPYITGEFVVDSIRRANYAEMFLSEGDTYFKVKVTFISIDEERGTEKKTHCYELVGAEDSAHAIDVINSRFGDSVADYSITAVSETKILDVFVLPEASKEEEAE